jgi:hypothetical protein
MLARILANIVNSAAIYLAVLFVCRSLIGSNGVRNTALVAAPLVTDRD